MSLRYLVKLEKVIAHVLSYPTSTVSSKFARFKFSW